MKSYNKIIIYVSRLHLQDNPTPQQPELDRNQNTLNFTISAWITNP